MIENVLKTFAVGDLLAQEAGKPIYNFFIPSYQRGYRWDKDQVEDLLNDLFEFITTSKSKEEKYCLQPIVVKQLADGRYEVLDGQQRLTTIYILLYRLKKDISVINLFSLEYETRPDSATFLNNIDEKINSKNADYFYISSAFGTINNWLTVATRNKANITTKLFDAIVESIEFIWYEIKNDVDPIDVFTRINIGKIPLTNAELVKAVFLSKNNLSLGYASSEEDDKDFSKILSLKQNAIALEWDRIEKVLQDPKVWGFIYGGTTTYETRIDYLLDLRSHKSHSDKNKYFSFKYFYDKVKSVRGNKSLLNEFTKSNTTFIEDEWSELKGIYDVLLEWYSDKIYNHLIGYLISQNVRIIEIVDDFKNNNRKTFLQKIKSRILRLIDCEDISKLSYLNGSDKNKIERILLLHNVVNSLIINDNNIYFPYERLKNKLWTLEHIFAQNSDDLREEDFNNWLSDHLEFFINKKEDENAQKIAKDIKELLSLKDSKIDKDDFQKTFGKVAIYISNIIQSIDKDGELDIHQNENDETMKNQEDNFSWINDDHSIANLALLDGSINSAIKNSLFDIKRKLILQKDKEGQFIPNETKKVFLKYYTSTPNHLAYWTYNDRMAYVKSILLTMNYLKNGENE